MSQKDKRCRRQISPSAPLATVEQVSHARVDEACGGKALVADFCGAWNCDQRRESGREENAPCQKYRPTRIDAQPKVASPSLKNCFRGVA
jgi:hypothetical protein